MSRFTLISGLVALAAAMPFGPKGLPSESGFKLPTAFPSGVVPTGFSGFPSGAFPTGAFPTGAFPTGAFPTGAFAHHGEHHEHEHLQGGHEFAGVEAETRPAFSGFPGFTASGALPSNFPGFTASGGLSAFPLPTGFPELPHHEHEHDHHEPESKFTQELPVDTAAIEAAIKFFHDHPHDHPHPPFSGFPSGFAPTGTGFALPTGLFAPSGFSGKFPAPTAFPFPSSGFKPIFGGKPTASEAFPEPSNGAAF